MSDDRKSLKQAFADGDADGAIKTAKIIDGAIKKDEFGFLYVPFDNDPQEVDHLVKRLLDHAANGCFDVCEDDLTEAAARIAALTAERDALRAELVVAIAQRDRARQNKETDALTAAIDAALERLDASLFTNAEHQQAKDILRAARKATAQP